jgi:hypothetical protein
VEFYVDQNGKARLPKVISSSLTNFGWEAATGIARWKYQSPMKDGLTVCVRMNAIVNVDVDLVEITW